MARVFTDALVKCAPKISGKDNEKARDTTVTRRDPSVRQMDPTVQRQSMTTGFSSNVMIQQQRLHQHTTKQLRYP